MAPGATPDGTMGGKFAGKSARRTTDRADAAAFDFAAYRGQPAAESERTSAGVLCIHGFTGTPFLMRYLGRSLAARGMRALGPLLPGHGTSPEHLAQTTWRDWYGAVEAGLDTLRATCERVAVAGLSLGGLLALHLAYQRPEHVTAVASLAAPLWLGGTATALLKATRSSSLTGRALARMLRKVPKFQGSDIRDRHMKRLNPGYRSIPLPALQQFVEFMNLVRADAHRVVAPTLVMHAPLDHTAPFGSARELAARISGARLHVLSRSYHNITIDVERDQVATSVGNFFGNHLRVAGGPAP